MKKQKEVIMIKKDEEKKIEIEIMEKAIVDVAEAAKKLNGSRLQQRAVVLLIQDAIGAAHISKQQIRDVLYYAERLGKLYLK